jgi:hypothetical protein
VATRLQEYDSDTSGLSGKCSDGFAAACECSSQMTFLHWFFSLCRHASCLMRTGLGSCRRHISGQPPSSWHPPAPQARGTSNCFAPLPLYSCRIKEGPSDRRARRRNRFPSDSVTEPAVSISHSRSGAAMKPPLLNFVLHLTDRIVANCCSQTPD